MMEIGLQMYTLRQVTDTPERFEEALKKAAEIGYRSIQAKRPSYLTAIQFRDILNRYGLHVDTLRMDTDRIETEIEALVRDGEILGTHAVRVESMNAGWALSQEGFLREADLLEKTGAFLRRHGLRLWYHFHAFEFINFPDGVRGIDILLNNTSAENVWFQPDLFWLTEAGTEASDSLLLFSGRSESIHVKDYQITERTNIKEQVPRAFAPVGCGNLNWKRILPAAESMGVKRCVVEQDECRDDPFDCIRISYCNLKRMFKEYTKEASV